jgi:thiol:disulfide interchange protein
MAVVVGFCLLPLAWFLIRRKNSPAGLVRLALIFSLGFLFSIGVLIEWLQRDSETEYERAATLDQEGSSG